MCPDTFLPASGQVRCIHAAHAPSKAPALSLGIWAMKNAYGATLKLRSVYSSITQIQDIRSPQAGKHVLELSLAFILAVTAAPASAAAQVTSEQALASFRAMFKSPSDLECPKEEGEIVVCGRRNDERSPYRLPLPTTPEPGSRVAGEPPKDFGGCTRLCHQPATINVIGTALRVAKGIKQVLEGDE